VGGLLLRRGGIVRALRESGADPTIATDLGSTPMAIAKQDPDDDEVGVSAEGFGVRGGAGGEILSSTLILVPEHLLLFYISWLRQKACCLGHGGWQEAERAYLLYKARQWPTSRGAARWRWWGGDEEGEEGEKKKALLDFVVHRLNGDLFPDLMEYMR
jgi:hypothetical protein